MSDTNLSLPKKEDQGEQKKKNYSMRQINKLMEEFNFSDGTSVQDSESMMSKKGEETTGMLGDD